MTALATDYAIEYDPEYAGLLGGDGAELLRLVVHDSPLPATDPTRFVTERTVTDIATVRAFLHWADQYLDVATLHALAKPHASIAPQHLQTVIWQATHASAICRARREQGLAVFSPQRVGVVRGFALLDGPATVLDDGAVAVLAHDDGLLVRTPDCGELDVREWTLDGDTATLATPDGQQQLTGLADALRLIAPGVEHGVLRRAPLTRLFAPLFVVVPEMARLAMTTHTPLIADRLRVE